MSRITVTGTGSAIADYLYDNVDFASEAFGRYRSEAPGDGGLQPGKLVLTDDFAEFARKKGGGSIDEVIREITSGVEPRSFNLGGPAIAALINAAQLLCNDDAEVSFYAANGNDEAGRKLRSILNRTPVGTDHFRDTDASSPYTVVFSDPTYHDGAGERTFLSEFGSSNLMSPDDLDSRFFTADIRLFGGTALVPPIHRALTSLLSKCAPGGLSIVSTVYDFAAEKAHPESNWPLGESEESYRMIDLLVMDAEEAIRLSGADTIDAAQTVFADRGLPAWVITRGTDDVCIHSDGTRFDAIDTTLPISRTNAADRGDVPWDTTGCGDNFVGGIIFSLTRQLADGAGRLDLIDAASWGVCSGDFACYYIGGTYIEAHPGEKLGRISAIHTAYKERNLG